MGLATTIGWTDATYNLWRGCTKVSAGCLNCYAEKLSHRNPAVLGRWGDHPRVVAAKDHRRVPEMLNADAERDGSRKRLFVNSLADVWDEWAGPLVDHRGHQLFVSPYNEWVTGEQRDVKKLRELRLDDVRKLLLSQVAACPLVDFQLVTKRPDNILPCLRRVADHAGDGDDHGKRLARRWVAGDPPKNVWLGTSVENHSSRLRVHILSEVPAALRFLSVEPILDEVDLSPWIRPHVERLGGFGVYQHLTTCEDWTCRMDGRPGCNGAGVPDASDCFHWVIVGGESGDGARACRLLWIEGVVSQCIENGVPVFVKQLGSQPVSTDPSRAAKLLQLRHPKGEDPAEWPEFFNVQEFPHSPAWATEAP